MKSCVGSPPRQTEDPLSPPCVAFFNGDNGGATHRGVTDSEIRVVFQLAAYSGSPSQPVVVDYDDPNSRDPDPTGDQIARAIRAFSKFFNSRYQTYGRHIHFWGYRGVSLTPEGIRAQVEDIVQKFQPFAILSTSLSQCGLVAKEAAERKFLAACYTGFDRKLQQRTSPFLLSYGPDLQDAAGIAASYVCDKLVNRPARFSGNPTDSNTTRKLGLLSQKSIETPEWVALKELFKGEIRRCGLTEVPERTVEAESNTTQQKAAEYAVNVADLRDQDVTTVGFFGGNSSALFWSSAAAAQGWYPEWLVPGSFLAVGPDTNFVPRQYNQAEWANAFGLSYDYRRGAPRSQFWHRAFNEGCGYCGDPGVSHPDLTRVYDVLVLLSWGIQSAGPKLTPANLDKGLHAIPPRPSETPSAPAAYFSSGNYSWIKDAMSIWWDPKGEEPGTGRLGCYRLTEDGKRWRAGEWIAGDDDIRRPSDICQGPDR